MEAHLGFFQEMNADLGDFKILKITGNSASDFYVDLEASEGEPVRLLIEFDPNPPNGLVGMQPIPFLDLSRLNINRPAELRQALTDLANENRFSGAIRIEDGGKTLFNEAFGLANKRYGIANTVQTRFAIGSITKVYTKLAILLLLEDGRLQLGDKVSRFVPEFQVTGGESISIWQLLRHESGLTDYWDIAEYRTGKRQFLDVEDYLPVLSALELDFAPGTARRYSNAGYVLLGIVIQRASGSSYYDFIRQRIFKPLGMFDSDFEQLTLVGKPYAIGYTNLSPMGPDNGFVRENTGILPGIGSPAGSSYSTIADLVKFDQAIWSGKQLSEATRRLFFSIDNVGSIEEGLKAPFPRAFSAAGGQPGENSVIISVPEKGRRLVVLSNFDERLAEDIGMHLYTQLKAADSDETSP